MAWPTEILMPVFASGCIDYFSKSVGNFETAYKTCLILVCGAVPPLQ